MATLEMQRPQRQRTAPLAARRSPSLVSASPAPCSPTIIRTPHFILLPSVPTHEPEDNLPSPMALQQQFAIAAHNDAQARHSRQNSVSDEPPTPGTPRTLSHNRSSSGSHSNHHHMMHDQDELEEIVEPDESSFDWDPTASHDALRDVRNQQLDSLQSILHSIAEAHLQTASSSSSAPHSEITQTLDDLFASLRRIGGHNAPLSPTFARSASTAAGVNHISDIDRLVLLVDRLTLAFGNVQDAQQAGLLANLTSLAQSLVVSQRRLSRAALDTSPPRTPRSAAAAHRRRSTHSAHSSSHRSASRNSFSSIQSYATPYTSSDEATPTAGSDEQHQRKFGGQQLRPAPSPPSMAPQQLEALSTVLEQQHIDGSTFDMATVRSAPSSSLSPSNTAFSIETLYAPRPSALGLMAPLSPRSDQASRAASVGEKSDFTALPNRKRFSVQTDSAASTALPSYDTIKKNALASEDLPQYDHDLSSAQARFSAADLKNSAEAPTLLERRRAKLAAQHSAYAARTPEDLAMVQSSIDHLSTVMPQLDNQRALSPEQQREAQLHHMMGRLAESSSQRMNDQRSNPPSLRASRPAPLLQAASLAVPAKPEEEKRPTHQLTAVSELPRKASLADAEPDAPKTPVTPISVHSAASSRRSSLLPSAFARKLSITSIGNAFRRASIYDSTKAKPKDVAEHADHQVGAAHSREPSGDATVRRRRAATQDSRSKSDIADGLASLFNDGKAHKNSAGEQASASKRLSQAGFRVIDFADDTPRGRDESLMVRASCEEEEDSMLDDYSFTTMDTSASNHRLSILPDPPRSPASWGSSGRSRNSSRRSSQLTGSNPATPMWPKSPLTPISPVASRRSPTKPTVSFAADTLQPPPAGRATAASLQSQLRDNVSAYYRPRKYPSDPPCESACVSAASASAAAAAAATSNDLIVYTVLSTHCNAADILARPVSACTSLPQSDQVDLEYFVEAQHTLGSISVMLWSESTQEVELVYELIDDVEQQCLYVAPLDGNHTLRLGLCDQSVGSGGGSGSERKRKQGDDHVRGRGVRIVLPAAAVAGQAGRVRVGSGVSRVKLELTEAARRAGAEESRGEGMVEFPLSAAELGHGQVGGLGCVVCGGAVPLLQMEGVEWRALPSEGWEELVDAWMCHADQELNRSLTETAVRFSSKIQSDGQADRTVWVGDTYLLIPRGLFSAESVVFDDDVAVKVMRCASCRNVLGEISSTASHAETATAKLSKYMVQPLLARSSTWMATLLATLQYAAASHGSRRFLIQPASGGSEGIETWLFSRALLTTSLSRHWSTLNPDEQNGVWKGHRLFYRPPSASTEAVETVELPNAVFERLQAALNECNGSLPPELRRVLPLWNAAYLARLVDGQ